MNIRIKSKYFGPQDIHSMIVMDVKLKIIKKLKESQPRKTTDLIKEMKINKQTFYSALKVLERSKIVKNNDSLISFCDYDSDEAKIEKALKEVIKESYSDEDIDDNIAFYEPNVLQILRAKHMVDEIAFKVGMHPDSKFKKILWMVAKRISKPMQTQVEYEDGNVKIFDSEDEAFKFMRGKKK